MRKARQVAAAQAIARRQGRWVRSGGGDADQQPDRSSARVTFRLSDRWAKYLLLALARRYGLKASRNRRWPELTIVLSGPEDVLDDLALQFEILSQELVNELEQATRRIIVEKVGQMQDYTWLRWGRF